MKKKTASKSVERREALQRKEKDPIQVWEYQDAPAAYQSLFSDDDADWLAFVPNTYQYNIWWLESKEFGCCDVQKEKTEGGTLYVGYHA